MTWYETLQGWIAFATLPVAAGFIGLFGRPSERWWVTWFGRSLMLLAVGVFAYALSVVLYRSFGDYPGRPALLLTAQTLVLLAMGIRTWVLWRAQRRDRTDHR